MEFHKQCKRCWTSFSSPQRGAKYCAPCKSIRNQEIQDCKRKWNLLNKEKIKQQQKARNTKNASKIKAYGKEYRAHNKTKIKEYQVDYKRKNKEKLNSYSKNYRIKNTDKVALYNKKKQIYNTEYRKNNKDKINSKKKERLKNDICFRIRRLISRDINVKLKTNGNSKNGSMISFLPFTMSELKIHLESQFEPWMTWKNHGVYYPKTWNDNDPSTWTWHIDHIVPQSYLQYDSMHHINFKKCWSLDNLRPLSAKQNVLDSNKRKGMYNE